MQPFKKIEAVAAALPMININTDMIIPKQFLKTIKRTGLGKYLFYELRTHLDETPNPDFVLNKTAWQNAQILVVGKNFGCGSSREHAPWALKDFGIQCVIAPSFADIFYMNAIKNGILPVALPEAIIAQLTEDAEKGANARITVDLENQQIIRPDGSVIRFEVDAFDKHCLLNGLDDIAMTLEKEQAIAEFEKKRRQHLPWL